MKWNRWKGRIRMNDWTSHGNIQLHFYSNLLTHNRHVCVTWRISILLANAFTLYIDFHSIFANKCSITGCICRCRLCPYWILYLYTCSTNMDNRYKATHSRFYLYALGCNVPYAELARMIKKCNWFWRFMNKIVVIWFLFLYIV